jgi:hypothetical protein
MALSNEEIQQQASQVLQGEDFSQYAPKTQSWDFWRWLTDHLNFRFPFETNASLGAWKMFAMATKWLLILLLVIAVGYLLYYLFQKWFISQDEDKKEWAVSEAERVEARESYAKMAQMAYHQKDFRLAIHYLFLATVSMVIRETHFREAEFLTNREIARSTDFSRLPQPKRLGAVFEKMVYFDEPRWFGRLTATQSDYDRFLAYYQQFGQSERIGHA